MGHNCVNTGIEYRSKITRISYKDFDNNCYMPLVTTSSTPSISSSSLANICFECLLLLLQFSVTVAGKIEYRNSKREQAVCACRPP